MQPGVDGWQRMRTHFCFLPLQISHFDELDRMSAYLSPSRSERDTAPLARMTEEGHLFLDPQTFSALESAVQEELDLEHAVQLRRAHQGRLRDLRVCAEHVARGAKPSWSLARWQGLWSSTAQAVAALAPYGLAAKVVVDLLLERAEAALPEPSAPEEEEDAETFPASLSSSALVSGVREVASRLQPAGADASRIPNTAAYIADLERFCQRHVGHGPRAWEAPGYEDPRYAWPSVARVATAAGVLGPEAATHRGAPLALPGPNPAAWRPEAGWEERPLLRPTTWRQELAYWTRHLDTRTTLLRWGFLVAERPLLSALAVRWIGEGTIQRASDLLFCTRHEVGGAVPSQAEIARRRGAYQALIREAGRPELAEAPEACLSLALPAAPLPLNHRSPASAGSDRGGPSSGEATFRGQSVSSAVRRSGPAWPMDAAYPHLPTKPGTVVVAHRLTPDLTPALIGAAAVVVEDGARLQHTSILARELGIPCVVGCHGVVARVAPGMPVTVDGSDGRVTIQGAVETP